MKRSLILCAVGAMALSGCAAPMVIPRDFSFQNKVAYASDWEGLANRAVDRFAATTKTTPPRVYVAPGPADMPFAVSYRRALEQSLLAHGYPVVETSAGAVVLSFTVQPYLYKNGRDKDLADYATFYTTAADLEIELGAIRTFGGAMAAGTGTGLFYDLLLTINDKTNAEVTVTTTVSDPDYLHYANAETFYVHPVDLPSYWSMNPTPDPQTMSRHDKGLAEVSLPVYPPR